MRYIKRILLILFLVIMISGCSVEYNVKINKDLSVNDVVYVSEKTDRLKSRTNLDVNQSVKFLYDIYKFNDMGENDYSITSSTDITRVASSNTYSDLEEYAINYRSDITDSPIITKKKNIVRFELDQTNAIDTTLSNRYPYDDITYTIEVPFKVIYNNADKVDGNRYTWYVKTDSYDLLRAIIEFDTNKTENKVSFGFGDTKVNIAYSWILVGIFVVIIIATIIFTYIKNKKSNKF